MKSRREALRAGATAALAASVAGCSGNDPVETRIEDIDFGNWQHQPNTMHLLILHEGEVVMWRTDDFEAAPEDPNTASPGVVIEDIPAEWTNPRVHARLNDEETAEFDLRGLGVECTRLKVLAMPADMGGGLSISHSTTCE